MKKIFLFLLISLFFVETLLFTETQYTQAIFLYQEIKVALSDFRGITFTAFVSETRKEAFTLRGA